jgi:hypothetical protein
MRAIAVVALVACNNSSPPPPPKPEPPAPIRRGKQYTAPQTIHLDAPAIDLPKQESFRLLDPGKGPRAPLRYQLAAGTVSYLADTKLSSRQLAKGAWTQPVAIAIRDGFAITVEPGKPLAFRALPGTGGSADYLATWKKLLENRRLTAAVDARGQLGAIEFADDPTNARSAAAKDELVQHLFASSVPLPAEPVAPGARWQVVTVLRQGPAYVKQTATYTLVTRAKKWTIAATIQRVGEEQTVTDASLPKGASADLIALFRKLVGSVIIDPQRPLPVGGGLTVESRLHVKITMPGQPPVEQVLEDTGSVAFSTSP